MIVVFCWRWLLVRFHCLLADSSTCPVLTWPTIVSARFPCQSAEFPHWLSWISLVIYWLKFRLTLSCLRGKSGRYTVFFQVHFFKQFHSNNLRVSSCIYLPTLRSIHLLTPHRASSRYCFLSEGLSFDLPSKVRRSKRQSFVILTNSW